jgi:hypothetical protein
MNSLTDLWDELWAVFYIPAFKEAFIIVGALIILVGFIALAGCGSEYKRAIMLNAASEEYKKNSHKVMMHDLGRVAGIFLAGILVMTIQTYTMLILFFVLLSLISFLAGWFLWGLIKNVCFALKNLKYK